MPLTLSGSERHRHKYGLAESPSRVDYSKSQIDCNLQGGAVPPEMICSPGDDLFPRVMTGRASGQDLSGSFLPVCAGWHSWRLKRLNLHGD